VDSALDQVDLEADPKTDREEGSEEIEAEEEDLGAEVEDDLQLVSPSIN
jgi:hypothetical protein